MLVFVAALLVAGCGASRAQIAGEPVVSAGMVRLVEPATLASLPVPVATPVAQAAVVAAAPSLAPVLVTPIRAPMPSVPASVATLPQGPARNRLVSADGTLNVPVGIYADCSGLSPISSSRADLDPCFPGRTYFVGHSPGVFSPLLLMHAGAEITWYDSYGNAERFRVIALRDFRRNSAPLGLAQPNVAAQFQTCLTADGSLDRILDAVRI